MKRATTTTHISVIGAAIWFFAAAALAAEPRPAAPVPDLKKSDLAGYLGWFNANKSELDSWNDWYNRSVLVGVGVGRYWGEHLKTEIDIGATSEARLEGSGPVLFPGSSPYDFLYARHSFRNVKLSVAQSYQFLHNAWVHPYLGAGVDLDWERHHYERPSQSVPRGFPAGRPTGFVQIPGLETTDSSLKPKVFAVGGLKAYVSQRHFFRTDLKVAGLRKFEQVTWRFGLGVDF